MSGAQDGSDPTHDEPGTPEDVTAETPAAETPVPDAGDSTNEGTDESAADGAEGNTDVAADQSDDAAPTTPPGAVSGEVSGGISGEVGGAGRAAAGSAMADRRGDRPDLSARRRRQAEAAEAAAAARGAASDGSTGAGETGAPRRRRWWIGVIAAVVVIALAVALIVYLLTRPDSPTPPPTSTETASPTTAPVLSAASMLSAAQAETIAPDGTFTVVSDSSGQATATSPACLSPTAVQNAPNPQAIRSRTLSTGGSGATLVLHQAQSFGSADEATVDFALLSRALGNCDLANSYLLRGSVITGLGDQSVGVVVEDQAKKQYRTVVVARTGVAVDVLDVVTGTGQGDPPLDETAKAMASIVTGQCTNAVGQCATLVKVEDGPPPAAGDQPGYLDVADLPQPQAGDSTWIGSNPGKPGALSGSGCENVDFSKVDATSSGARTYLLDQKPTGTPDSFGIDEAVFTMSDADGAAALVKQLNDNIASCKERQLTAAVSDKTDVNGVGAEDAEVDGTTYKITQQINDDTTSHFRLGVATIGSKVVYLFLPTQDRFDVTDDQWSDLLVRAAARASQVS